jgi:hypothetical protein
MHCLCVDVSLCGHHFVTTTTEYPCANDHFHFGIFMKSYQIFIFHEHTQIICALDIRKHLLSCEFQLWDSSVYL